MTILVGDCLSALAGRSGFEAAIADLPSGASFMNLRFDLDHGGQDRWVEHFAERLRVMREACIPGAYGLFWTLPRTSHWTSQAVEKAGWKIVDKVAHVYGTGWPKGRGQLKPAREDWILCRDPRGKVRPLNVDGCRVRRSWAERSESWFRSGRGEAQGAGSMFGMGGKGINVNEGGSWPPNMALSHCSACVRVGARRVKGTNTPTISGGKMCHDPSRAKDRRPALHYNTVDGTETVPAWECLAVCECGLASTCPAGGAPTPCACGGERFWACPVAELDGQSGHLEPSGTAKLGKPETHASSGYGGGLGPNSARRLPADSGGASRFFPTFHYDAKASKAERQAGCEGLLWIRDKAAPIGWRRVSAEEHAAAPEKDRATGNVHATIKPIGCGADDGFMRWAVRLVTPEGGPIVDGTCGSGSTLVAAQIEGRDYFGCDIDPGAVDIALARVAHWTQERHLSLLAKTPKRKGIAPAPQVAASPPAGGPKQLDIFGGRAA